MPHKGPHVPVGAVIVVGEDQWMAMPTTQRYAESRAQSLSSPPRDTMQGPLFKKQ